MKAAQRVFANRRLRQESAWQFLALDHAPFVLGVLDSHLFGKDRRLPASVFIERLRQDLDDLRAQGLDLPQSAEAYAAQWLRSGFIERSYEADATEEEYELSAPAIKALQVVRGLTDERTIATESRLSLVIDQVRRLAEQTETDPELRIESLMQERARLDGEILAVREGRMESLSSQQALERTREIIALSDELANDFRRVRDEFQQLNRGLRETIVENDGSRGDVLDAVFSGVDLIAESDAGRAFKAFWVLLTDMEEAAAFDAALVQLLSREFIRDLRREERGFMFQLTRLLLERGGEVHEVLQTFARSLKQFVQSREYREQRRLHELLKSAQSSAFTLKERVRPTTGTGHTLYLTSAKIGSVSQWRLHDPRLDAVDSNIRHAGQGEFSLESIGELLVHSDIDFRRLQEQIEELLRDRSRVTISQVLEAYSADQGLGSVVGLIDLGLRRGIRTDTMERIAWTGLDGVARSAWIPRIYFMKELSSVER